MKGVENDTGAIGRPVRPNPRVNQAAANTQVADVGGRRLAYQKLGTGPVVVLETGGGTGGIGLAWNGVERRIAEFATAIAYDRAGTGLSDRAEAAPTLADRARDLAALLAAVPVNEPVVLVGWSLGGLIVQQFAVQYPARVAGIVLVDPTPVDSYTHFKPWQRRLMPLQLHLFAGVARLGLFKTRAGRAFLHRMLAAQVGPRFDPGQLRVLVDVMADVRMHDVMRMEVAHLAEVCDAAAALFATTPLPRVPLVLLSAGWRGRGPVAAKFAPILAAAHQKIVDRAPGSELRVLDGIGHHVPFEAPDAIPQAVRDVLARIR